MRLKVFLKYNLADFILTSQGKGELKVYKKKKERKESNENE